MSSVTQTIPTLTGGLSQQPDELKVPGQVNVANNVLPDVTPVSYTHLTLPTIYSV